MSSWRVGAILAVVAACLSSLASAETAEDFYRGKMMTMYVGFAPGGSYDIYARFLAKFMGDHIPGKPIIVPHNMPGGGSRVLAGFVYNVAPKDGTVLATIDQSLPLQQAMGEKLTFDVSKLAWIGNVEAGTNVLATWYTSGVKTIEDARKKEVPLGSTGSGSAQQVKMINLLLGTRFKIVPGYPGGSAINIALERGEVAARTNTWASFKATSSAWLRDHKINILVQIGLIRAKDLPGVPLLTDLARNDEDRTLLKLLSAPATIGRPTVATPGLAEAKVKLLRAAFDATVADPAFLAEAKRAHLEINPMSGAELETIVTEVVTAPKPLAKRLATMLDPGGSR